MAVVSCCFSTNCQLSLDPLGLTCSKMKQMCVPVNYLSSSLSKSENNLSSKHSLQSFLIYQNVEYWYLLFSSLDLMVFFLSYKASVFGHWLSNTVWINSFKNYAISWEMELAKLLRYRSDILLERIELVSQSADSSWRSLNAAIKSVQP